MYSHIQPGDEIYIVYDIEGVFGDASFKDVKEVDAIIRHPQFIHNLLE